MRFYPLRKNLVAREALPELAMSEVDRMNARHIERQNLMAAYRLGRMDRNEFVRRWIEVGNLKGRR